MYLKHPEFLYLYLLIPALIIFLTWSYQKSKKAILQFCHPKHLKTILPSFSKKLQLFKFFFLSLALTMFITTIVSPRWGYDWKEIESKGTNIFIAIDVSKSMLADDINPSRLFRAKLELEKLVNQLDGDRLGLIIFAGKSFLQSPLTHDYQMIKNWIKEINVDSVPIAGTSIKSAIDMAIKGFSPVKTGAKILIVISDGEEQDESTKKKAEEAKELGIRIVSIGIGSNQGAPIKYQGELIKDKEGNIVVSKLNDKLLKEIAEITDGKYIRSRTGNFHLEQLYRSFIRNENESVKLKSGKVQRWHESFQIFLGLAFIFLLIELLSNFNFKNFFSIFLLFSLIFNSHPAHAFINTIQGNSELKKSNFEKAKDNYIKDLVKNPNNPRLNYHLGICLYKENDFKAAQNSFEQSIKNNSQDNFLKEKSFYNLGNSFFKQKDYKSAINAYKSSLAIDPKDLNAQFNLKLAEKLLEEEQKEDKEKDTQDKKNKDKKDEQKEKEEKNKQENQNELSKEEIENLLMQIQEAKNPQRLNTTDSKQKNDTKLNPW